MIGPLFLVDAFKAMGASQQIITAALFGLIVLYLHRGRSVARSIVGIIGTLWIIAVGIMITFGIAVALGWISIRPDVIFTDLETGAAIAGDAIGRWLGDLLRGLLP